MKFCAECNAPCFFVTGSAGPHRDRGVPGWWACATLSHDAVPTKPKRKRKAKRKPKKG